LPAFPRWGIVLVIGALLAAGSPCEAQSLDPQKPAALAAGINKGNVDSMQGSHYYYFFAGPGHFDVNMAFKGLGLFGAPLRQALSFDFYDDDAKLLSHNAITSTADIERLAIKGDLDKQQRIRLAIIPQKGLIRLGGYYEIGVSGAAEFEGSAGATAGVTPQSSALVQHGSTTLVAPGTRLVGPTTTLVGPSTTLVSPSTTLVKPGSTSLTGPAVSLNGSGRALTMNETEHEVRLAIAADVLFDFDKSTIRSDAAEALQQLAEVIREKNHGVVRIEGHTDSKGGVDYNKRLSDARAKAVQNWLVEKDGFVASTFTIQGFGATRPVAPNKKPDGRDDPEGRQRNRRVELVIAK
jgi:outer membrane protein OmpA-like peptidoglycan-associated protein